MIPEVEALWADERGALLGLLAAGDAGAAAGLGGPAGGRCRVALAALAALPEDERRVTLEGLTRAVAAPVPEGLEGAHPGWLRRVLEGESSDVVRAVAGVLPAAQRRVTDELLAARGERADARAAWPESAALDELRRHVLAPLAPMPATGGVTLEALDARGATTLGLAPAGAPDDVLARAAAGVGASLAGVVIAAARSGAPGARAAARALVATVPPAEAAAGAARAVGLRALAADLADEGPAARAACAQRLPPAVGDALLSLLERPVGGA